MDPNAALHNIRQAVSLILNEDSDDAVKIVLAEDLAEAVNDLDVWLAAGGFPPSDWLHEDD